MEIIRAVSKKNFGEALEIPANIKHNYIFIHPIDNKYKWKQFLIIFM